MRTRLISGLGIGAAALAAGLVLGVPAIAAASTSSAATATAVAADSMTDPATLLAVDPTSASGTPTGTCPDPAVQTKVTAYLAANPDVKAELVKLQAEPAAQRRAEVASYAKTHPVVRAAVRATLEPARMAYVAGHPEVKGLFDAVQAAPMGDKVSAGKAYVLAHPVVKADLVQLRGDLRACIVA